MITSVGYQTYANADGVLIGSEPQTVSKITIIIDAGHGGEDPGAVANGSTEKDLNLSVSKKLATYLTLSGYHVIMTRTDDRLLYNDGEEAQKKYFDLYNRVELAESFDNSIFISIHMNKYPLESCKGLQTFYSTNNELSTVLATWIQNTSKALMPNNNRQIKADQGTIFLLKNLKIPAILVECGFLSNKEEALLLTKDAYQNKLALVLSSGIINYIKESEQANNYENKLYLQ